MKIKMTFLTLSMLFALAITQATGQTKTALYKNDKFSIEYAANWKTSNEDDAIIFSPGDFGMLVVTVDTFNTTMEATRSLLLEAYEVKDKPENVKMTKKGNVTEFYYEYIKKNEKCILKAFRRNADFYVVAINCDLKKWDANKDAFLKALDSFRVI